MHVKAQIFPLFVLHNKGMVIIELGSFYWKEMGSNWLQDGFLLDGQYQTLYMSNHAFYSSL